MSASENFYTQADRDKNINQLQEWLRELGQTERSISATEALYNDQREELQRQFEATIKPLREKRTTLYRCITIMSEGRREMLLHGKRSKQIVLPTGKIYWKKTRGAMKFLVSEEELLAFLAASRLSAQAVRIKREVMRSKIAKHPSVAQKLEMAGLIRRGEGREVLHIEPLKLRLDTPDTGKVRTYHIPG